MSKKKITLKKGQTVEIDLEDLTQVEPKLRQMTLSICVMANGQIRIGTVYTGSFIASAEINHGSAHLTAQFTHEEGSQP